MEHEFSIPGLVNDARINLLINNLFDLKYVSHGTHYFYNDSSSGSLKTTASASYFPMAGRNFLIGLNLKF